MNIAVFVKQIPDQSVVGNLNSDFRFNREGKITIDEADLYGVELALQLRDSVGSGQVSLISMAPNSEVVGIKNALAMGADNAIVISDIQLSGSHSLATAKVLNAAISKLENIELIIAGTESSDGYTGLLPAQIGELRKISVLSFATSVEIVDGVIKINRQTELGIDIVSAKLPAIVSVTAGCVEPRYPNFKGIMAAKSKPIEFYDLADLGIDLTELNIDNQNVFEMEPSEVRSAGEKIEDEEIGVGKIIDLLESHGAL